MTHAILLPYGKFLAFRMMIAGLILHPETLIDAHHLGGNVHHPEAPEPTAGSYWQTPCEYDSRLGKYVYHILGTEEWINGDGETYYAWHYVTHRDLMIVMRRMGGITLMTATPQAMAIMIRITATTRATETRTAVPPERREIPAGMIRTTKNLRKRKKILARTDSNPVQALTGAADHGAPAFGQNMNSDQF